MQIDTAMLAIFVTILLAIISLSAWLGATGQRVRQHGKDISNVKKEGESNLDKLHKENREDHQRIFTKLEEINLFIRNGRTKE